MATERPFKNSKVTGRFLPVNVPAENSILYSRKRLSEEFKKYAWLEALTLGKLTKGLEFLRPACFDV